MKTGRFPSMAVSSVCNPLWLLPSVHLGQWLASVVGSGTSPLSMAACILSAAAVVILAAMAVFGGRDGTPAYPSLSGISVFVWGIGLCACVCLCAFVGPARTPWIWLPLCGPLAVPGAFALFARHAGRP